MFRLVSLCLVACNTADREVHPRWFVAEAACVGGTAEWEAPDGIVIVSAQVVQPDGGVLLYAGNSFMDNATSWGCTDDLTIVYAVIDETG